MARKISEQIDKLGEKLAHCEKKCLGIKNDPLKGILPRCLMLEITKRDESITSIIVGINPGQSKQREREYFIREGANYSTWKKYWETKIKKLSYYEKLRKFITQLGYKEGILWTELVKCQNEEKCKEPPLQTFRVCIKNYLERELESVPNEIPIIAVGNKVFEALSYRFPNRLIIGVPHPTGSYGNFRKLFEKNGKIKKQFLKLAREINDKEGNWNSIKLFPKKTCIKT